MGVGWGWRGGGGVNVLFVSWRVGELEKVMIILSSR